MSPVSLCPAIVLAAVCLAGPAVSDEIRNPFYKEPAWKLWREDASPVTNDGVTVSPLTPGSRIYPAAVQTNAGERLLKVRYKDWGERACAGMWDDVYASFDNQHSFIRDNGWYGDDDHFVLVKGQAMELSFAAAPTSGVLKQLGLNFTSQSTTEMGHDLTDSFEDIDRLERDYYFANVLRAGPAHISYREKHPDKAVDRYDAMVPCFYNSVGSSGSEENAILKMMIAGACLPVGTKVKLKRHGLYIPTLLYIWKASLPYDVPYDNELRHRVAYASHGSPANRRLGVQAKYNLAYHRYDENTHLRRMARMAMGMDAAPPVAVLADVVVEGGELKSVNRTAVRVHQGSEQTVTARFSAADSFDMQGLPLTYKCSVLYGNPATAVRRGEKEWEFIVSVPSDAGLPSGRTVVILVANNSRYDSNPAVINVYRPDGEANLRPSLNGLDDVVVAPGETVRLEIDSQDPEECPVTFYRWSGEVGHIEGNAFVWTCPADAEPGARTVSVIASDGTGGYNSRQVNIQVEQVAGTEPQSVAPATP